MSVAERAPPSEHAIYEKLMKASRRRKNLSCSWTKNTKIKTCKCCVCNQRVELWSQQCDECEQHVCSECLDPATAKCTYYHYDARNRVEVGCWFCNYRSGIPPGWQELKPRPERRTEEEARDKASKAKGMQRKAEREAAMLAQCKHEDDEDGESIANTSSDESEDDHFEDFVTNADTTNDRENSLFGGKRKHNTEESDSNLFIESENSPMAPKGKVQKNQSTASPEDGQRPVPRLKLRLRIPRASIETLQISPPSDTPGTSVKSAPASHLEGGSTVIVGAGVVGLFIAYQIGLKLHEEGIHHDITVVEIRESFGQLASKHCAGVLTTSGMPEAWTRIAGEARQQWEELKDNQDFFYNVYQSNENVLRAMKTSPSNTEKAPTWFRGSSEHSFLHDPKSFGRVDPKVLSSWLYEQCTALNVKFLFKHNVCGTEYTSDSVLRRVYVEDGTEKTARIPCHNLILSAGPFTTAIFDSLFERSSVELENRIRTIYWFRVPCQNEAEQGRATVQIIDAAHDVERLDGDLTMAVSSKDNVLTVSAVSATKVYGNLKSHHALHVGLGKTTDLRQLASKYLNGEDMDVTDERVWPIQGASRINTANGGNPIIDRLTVSRLGIDKNQKSGVDSGGVFLCYGFGGHGTALAPGAAHIVVSKMFHDVQGIDNYGFEVPQ